MGKRFTEQDLSKFQENSGRRVSPPTDPTTRLMPKKEPKPRKYNNEPVVVDGMKFDSKLEARRYGELKLLQGAKQVLYFLRQVPFHLPGGVIYRVDFQIFWGSSLRGLDKVTYEDTHGADTRIKTLKLKQVKALYGVEVKLVREVGR